MTPTNLLHYKHKSFSFVLIACGLSWFMLFLHHLFFRDSPKTSIFCFWNDWNLSSLFRSFICQLCCDHEMHRRCLHFTRGLYRNTKESNSSLFKNKIVCLFGRLCSYFMCLWGRPKIKRMARNKKNEKNGDASYVIRNHYLFSLTKHEDGQGASLP